MARSTMRNAETMPLADIHTHILPGVDDGAAEWKQTMLMLKAAYRDGTRMIVLTPHFRGKYKRPAQELEQIFEALCERVQESYPDMELFLGNEIHYEQAVPELLEAGEILTINGSDYCLLEFRTGALRSKVITGLSEVLRYGYIPIIAHAERYDVFLKDKTLVDEVLQMGALIQLNADSVMGQQGFAVKNFCHRLLKKNQAHFIASDAHDTKNRPPCLRACWEKVAKKYGADYAARVFCDNILAVIENEII